MLNVILKFLACAGSAILCHCPIADSYVGDETLELEEIELEETELEELSEDSTEELELEDMTEDDDELGTEVSDEDELASVLAELSDEDDVAEDSAELCELKAAPSGVSAPPAVDLVIFDSKQEFKKNTTKGIRSFFIRLYRSNAEKNDEKINKYSLKFLKIKGLRLNIQAVLVYIKLIEISQN